MSFEKTKADALCFLKEKQPDKFLIEDLMVFTVEDWQERQAQLVKELMDQFNPRRIVARSSAINEDTSVASMAGYYESELNINSMDDQSIIDAINNVVRSYEKSGELNRENQILVQSQTEDVKVSGVIFTCDNENGAPYYVINYDDQTGKTDTITSGKLSSLKYISRALDTSSLEDDWKSLILAIKDIEQTFDQKALDIEFAIREDGSVVIYQVRPLVINTPSSEEDDKKVFELIKHIKQKFTRLNERIPHLCGSKTILGDMPDWNPAEILGDRPNTLDYSLYGHIITDEVWQAARRSLGYADVFPGELMIALGKKPYIDCRLSFNSFVPESLDFNVREKLVNYYLDSLSNNVSAQDKVEFEVLWTCYDFCLKDEINALKGHGFSSEEIDSIIQSLHGLTSNILDHYKDMIAEDLDATKILTSRRDEILKSNTDQESVWQILTTAHYVIENCKQFGTLPFSRLARLAFIGKSFLISLNKDGVLSDEEYSQFLASIDNVATNFNKDSRAFQAGEISENDFIEKYGHLRLGTYDITSPTYKDLIEVLKGEVSEPNEEKAFALNDELKSKVNQKLQEHNFNVSADELFDFIKQALTSREVAKFEFTKSLSTAIELIAKAGDLLGFSREELCHVDYPTLMKFRNPEFSDSDYAKDVIQKSIEKHRSNKKLFEKVILPAVVTDVADIDYINTYQARPNFITRKSIQGQIHILSKENIKEDISLKGKIVVIENADPGYDWIFSKEPLALITKFGGVASHMAIRCSEFGLPAAIGCGEIIYRKIQDSKTLLLNCQNKVIEFIG